MPTLPGVLLNHPATQTVARSTAPHADFLRASEGGKRAATGNNHRRKERETTNRLMGSSTGFRPTSEHQHRCCPCTPTMTLDSGAQSFQFQVLAPCVHDNFFVLTSLSNHIYRPTLKDHVFSRLAYAHGQKRVKCKNRASEAFFKEQISNVVYYNSYNSE